MFETPFYFCLKRRPLVAFFVVVFFSVFGGAAPGAVWQWSVPAPSIEGRRAFLWVAPECRRVRGLVVACQNMLEQPLFERPAFRSACKDAGLGILMIYSGHDKGPDDDRNPDHPVRSALDIFLNPTFPDGQENPKGAGDDLQGVLNRLAQESGYGEIRYAPLLPVGHSSAGNFVWHLYRWDASRIFAMMPFKTAIKDDGPQGIPIFNVESEWFDYGSGSHNVSSKPEDIDRQLRARGNGDDSLFGFYVDIGAGHCDVSDDSIPIVGMFLKKAVAARIPMDTPINRPIALKSVNIESGWLIDVAAIGKPNGRVISYADFRGDRKHAFWYLDREMAETVQRHMVRQYAKRPQQLNFLQDGVAPTTGGTFVLYPKFLDDGATFKVQAAFIDHMTDTDLFAPDFKLYHSDTPIHFRVNSGGLVQVGTNMFRVCPRAGPLVPQGNPWEPTLVAYNLGDDRYRPTERPAHVSINIVNTEGPEQTIDFPKIPDQHVGKLAPLKLSAHATSNLPVQFFMVSGPATIEGDVLTFDKIPARARFPVRVMVSAFQWGRSNDPKVRSAGPTTREFYIQP
jgi:hypothetical protein